MRITSKGQVTIPVEIREKAGLLPGTEVDFELDGDGVRIVRAKAPRGETRGQRIVRRLRGSGTVRMTTDEIMALMRGENDTDPRSTATSSSTSRRWISHLASLVAATLAAARRRGCSGDQPADLCGDFGRIRVRRGARGRCCRSTPSGATCSRTRPRFSPANASSTYRRRGGDANIAPAGLLHWRACGGLWLSTARRATPRVIGPTFRRSS